MINETACKPKTSNAKAKDTSRNMDYTYNRISFFMNGKAVSADLPPAISTLDYLNKSCGLYGTKCSCNEGDCGACTVVIAYVREGAVMYEAINSCLYPAAKLHGKHLLTIEALGSPDQLHPIQEAMLRHHSTQCGYCSPGFVMSAFALFAMKQKPSREEILAALEGNLCRCTGYDSILNAMEELSRTQNPETIVPTWARALEPELFRFKTPVLCFNQQSSSLHSSGAYHLPSSLEEAFSLLEEHPEARIINGGTDIMVQVNIARLKFPVLIDISGIDCLRQISLNKDGVRIGAAVTYSDLERSGIVKTDLPWLLELTKVLASRQIRNFGTLSGNIANASPIGDSLPLLLVLNASLILSSKASQRQIPLKDFFLSYKKTALAAGELITEIVIPIPPQGAYIKFIKAVKRKAVDISAIASAICLETNPQGLIKTARLALGGAAEIPKLSSGFSSILGIKPEDINAEELANLLASEFQPISDVRGSAAYRQTLIKNQILKYLDEVSRRQP